MQDLPHHYTTTASGNPDGLIPLQSPGLEDLNTDAPAEFGGSGDYWSPETLLVGAVANCFILTFRALSRKAGLNWTHLRVSAEGTLDKGADGLRFSEFVITAHLDSHESDPATVRTLLEKSKKHCLITNSLTANCELRIDAEA
jgi:organic hydroperoxide reductase OsmC/OhrA